MRLKVFLSSRSGVTLWFQPLVTLNISLVIGTSLVLYDSLHACAQQEFDVVSIGLFYFFLWFHSQYDFYAMNFIN